MPISFDFVETGSSANDGTGDPLRSAFNKLNQNLKAIDDAIVTGTSGTSGTSGATGPQGDTGTGGTSGTSGSSGTSGLSQGYIFVTIVTESSEWDSSKIYISTSENGGIKYDRWRDIRDITSSIVFGSGISFPGAIVSQFINSRSISFYKDQVGNGGYRGQFTLDGDYGAGFDVYMDGYNFGYEQNRANINPDIIPSAEAGGFARNITGSIEPGTYIALVTNTGNPGANGANGSSGTSGTSGEDGITFPYTGNVNIEGNLSVTGSTHLTGSGGTLFLVEGDGGELLKVTDDFDGVLFEVNDISGLPIIEVSSDTTIGMGTFGAEAIIVSSSDVNFNNLPTSDPEIAGRLFQTSSLAVGGNGITIASIQATGSEQQTFSSNTLASNQTSPSPFTYDNATPSYILLKTGSYNSSFEVVTTNESTEGTRLKVLKNSLALINYSIAATGSANNGNYRFTLKSTLETSLDDSTYTEILKAASYDYSRNQYAQAATNGKGILYEFQEGEYIRLVGSTAHQNSSTLAQVSTLEHRTHLDILLLTTQSATFQVVCVSEG